VFADSLRWRAPPTPASPAVGIDGEQAVYQRASLAE